MIISAASGATASGEIDDADRDTWCTPRAWARRIGRVWLDPCSNDRSHIEAERTWRLDRGQNALVLAKWLPRTTGLIFVNPPYSRGMVEQFVLAFRHTRFCFLVRGDTSTDWWESLWPYVGLECRPRERMNFEPPPGAESSSNPYPHSLLYSRAEDATLAVLAASYVCEPRHAWRSK